MRTWEKKVRTNTDDDPEFLLKKYLTKKELRHIKFRSLRKGTLRLDVDSSSWLYYFNLRKEAFLADLRKQSSCIKDVRLYIGETR